MKTRRRSLGIASAYFQHSQTEQTAHIACIVRLVHQFSDLRVKISQGHSSATADKLSFPKNIRRFLWQPWLRFRHRPPGDGCCEVPCAIESLRTILPGYLQPPNQHNISVVSFDQSRSLLSILQLQRILFYCVVLKPR